MFPVILCDQNSLGTMFHESCALRAETPTHFSAFTQVHFHPARRAPAAGCGTSSSLASSGLLEELGLKC